MRFDNPAERCYLTIGEDCIVGGTFVFESKEGMIRIGKHSYIGDSMFISRSGIEIGDNVTIGAGSVVTKDIPSNVIAHGNPCKVYRNI